MYIYACIDVKKGIHVNTLADLRNGGVGVGLVLLVSVKGVLLRSLSKKSRAYS